MLDLMMTLVVPLTLGLVAVYAACRRVDVYDSLQLLPVAVLPGFAG